MTGRDISCLWNCYSLFAQREFIEALQEFSENFQHSNESDWSVPGGYNCMLPGFTVFLQCHPTYFLSLAQQIHCIRISAFFKVKKEQATKANLNFTPPSNVLNFLCSF